MSYTLKFFIICSIYVSSCSTPSFSSPANSSHPLKLTYLVVAIARHMFTLSALPNDVMSRIEFEQVHSETFRRRHITLQSHGLFALARHLYVLYKLTAEFHFSLRKQKSLKRGVA